MQEKIGPAINGKIAFCSFREFAACYKKFYLPNPLQGSGVYCKNQPPLFMRNKRFATGRGTAHPDFVDIKTCTAVAMFLLL